MSFPIMNAFVNTLGLSHARGNSTITKPFEVVSMPLFQVPAVVDVSGMELAIATQLDGLTGALQTLASGTTTVVYKPHDGNTNAGGATDNNEIFAVTDFSNSATGAGSWTVVHGAVRAVGTSTTDLDADDWVNLDVAAMASGAAGHGAIAVNTVFIYGKPAAIN